MELRELKKIVDNALEERKGQIFVIVGEERPRPDGAMEATGTDVVEAMLSFDNGGPVLLLVLEKDEEDDAEDTAFLVGELNA